jgi:hypothetical protein
MVLESTAGLKYEMLAVPVCENLDRLRYYLRSANSFIQQQMKLLFDPANKTTSIERPGQPTVTVYEELMPGVQSKLRDALRKAKERADVALGDSDEALPAAGR